MQGWRLAKERARRYNRNLLQYAGGVVALLGIGSGTAAVAAVAQGLGELDLPWEAIVSIAAVVGLVFLFLSIFLLRAFWLRGEAERDVAEHLSKLIALDPDRFWSSEE